MAYDSIRPGKPWMDTSGKRIQTHGGSMRFEDGVFYWYGEDKEKTLPGSNVWHAGVRCYSSTDLYNWEDRGSIIPAVPEDESSPLHPAQLMDRPHIIHNPRTGKYVCWLKIMGDGGHYTVLTSDHFLGPYEMVVKSFHPVGMKSGDFDLVVDPQDGKAYCYFERPHRELICADLTDDFTGTTGYYSTHFPRPIPPEVREAPAFFSREGSHYLITSGTTGYFPNPSEIAVSPSYHGPWTQLPNPHPGDASRTSFRSQISSVFKHPHKNDLYIAVADRWLPELSAEESNKEPEFRRMYSGETPAEVFEHPEELLGANTSIADYVLLPIRFEGEHPVIDWLDEWRVEDYS